MRDFRGSLLCAAVCAILLAWQATAELYDESLSVEVDTEDNKVDSGPLSAASEDPEEELQLRKLFNSVQAEDSDEITQNKNKQEYPPAEEMLNLAFDYDMLEDSIMKRRADKKGSDKNIQPKVLRSMMKVPRKWQIMKGKFMGSYMVCYFKLCAFRRPVN